MILTDFLLSMYVIIGIVCIISIIVMRRSEKYLSIISIIQPASYLVLSIYAALYVKLPLFFTKNSFFFIDTFALYEVIIASLIFLLTSVYLRGYLLRMIADKEIDQKYIKLFHVGFNLLLLIVVFAFFSNNLALFWIFLELTTLVSVLLITLLKSKENIVAGLHYIFIVSPAMIFSFIGIIILYVATQATGYPTLNWFDIMHVAGLSGSLLELAFIFIFIGFAAKSGIVPFHNWLPKAYSVAPSPVSVLMSAIVSSMGIYGIIRMLAICGQTEILNKISWILIVFGILSLAVASFTMLKKRNFKMMLAFSSIEQVGIILIGIGIATKASIFWAILYMTFHSIVKALLFFSAGVFNIQYQSNDAESIFNVIKLQPLASIGVIVGSVAIIGLPPFLLFAPKIFMLAEIGRYSLVILGIVLLFILVAISAFTIFMSKMFSNIKINEESTEIKKYELASGMRITIIILIIMTIFLGLYIPETLQNIIQNIVVQLGF